MLMLYLSRESYHNVSTSIDSLHSMHAGEYIYIHICIMRYNGTLILTFWTNAKVNDATRAIKRTGIIVNAKWINMTQGAAGW